MVVYNHHHSFIVPVPLRVGRAAPIFDLSFFLDSILFAGSILVSVQFCEHLLSCLSISTLVYLLPGDHQLLVLLCC